MHAYILPDGRTIHAHGDGTDRSPLPAITYQLADGSLVVARLAPASVCQRTASAPTCPDRRRRMWGSATYATTSTVGGGGDLAQCDAVWARAESYPWTADRSVSLVACGAVAS